jgi:hypothetical protein
MKVWDGHHFIKQLKCQIRSTIECKNHSVSEFKTHFLSHLYVCLFVVYLTTLFQYLRLYSVDFYSSLIRLPSSSEGGETRVRNMAAEFWRRAPIVLVGFFNMP